jgi:plastocyanin
MSCDIDGPVDEYSFTPAVTWVEVGATVSWAPTSPCRQQTLAFHPDNDLPLRMPETADPWQSPVVQGTNQRSSQFTHTFEQAGVYNYAGLHEEFGQVGVVVVGRPDDPDGEPGLQPPALDGASPQAVERLRFLVDEVRELLGVEER